MKQRTWLLPSSRSGVTKAFNDSSCRQLLNMSRIVLFLMFHNYTTLFGLHIFWLASIFLTLTKVFPIKVGYYKI